MVSELKTLDSGFLVSGTWIQIPIAGRIMDSLSRILDSKAHDSGLYQQKFSGFQISQEKLPQIPDPKSGLTYMGQTVNTAGEVPAPLL